MEKTALEQLIERLKNSDVEYCNILALQIEKELLPIDQSQREEIARRSNRTMNWIDAVLAKPNCYELGDWDGYRSDWCLVQNDKGYFIARAYDGCLDGTRFFEWYGRDGYEVTNVQKFVEIV